jgi:ribosomal protein L23
MALFNAKDTKKEDATAVAPRGKKGVAAEASAAPVSLSAHMLISARITEKSTDLAASNVFVFNVKPSANKRQVIEAVKALYKVTPINVRMVKIATKEVRHARIGVVGSTNKAKKAYVQLKKGDTISLM